MKIFQSHHRENHREAPLNAKRNTKLQRGTISPVVSTSSLAERARGRQFVFVALNGVREENGYVWKGLTPSTIRQSRAAEKREKKRKRGGGGDTSEGGTKKGRDGGGRLDIKVKPRSIRSAPIVNRLKDQFLTETLENVAVGPLSPSASTVFAACRASHNCDLRGTGQLRPGDNAAATRDGQSNNLDPADAFARP